MLALGPIVMLTGSTVTGFIVSAAADVNQGSFDPYSIIPSAITPAIVIALLLTGKLHTHAEVARLEADCKMKEDTIRLKDSQLAALQESIVDKAIPALTRSTLVLETLSPILSNEFSVHPPTRTRRPSGP